MILLSPLVTFRLSMRAHSIGIVDPVWFPSEENSQSFDHSMHTRLFQSQSVRTPRDVFSVSSEDIELCLPASARGSGSPEDDPGQT